MIDIHTHIIPNIDDGSRSVEETFKLINEAEEAGFTDIILTPHYITNYYETPGAEVKFWTESLQKIVDEKNLGVKLHSGMEIYISEELSELVKNGIVITLANSKYILIELPMNTTMKNVDEILFIMRNMGYNVIIAHPERYNCIQENIEYAIQLVEEGCMLQSNYGSIVDIYGKEAKKTLKKLLKMNLVSFLGTDTHKEGTIYPIMPQIIKKLRKVISEEKLYEITTENPRKILENQD
ncbi:MAG: capsular biosynthesis protein [Clostridia bacterium]|nr:capsular biosynthesis protein [Clostridia bacterium]